MRRDKIIAGVMVVLLLVGLVACQQGNAAKSQSVTDALGRTVHFDTPPQQMVITGRANFMLNDAVYLFPDAPQRVLALTQATQAASAFVNLLDPEAEAKTRFMSDAAAEEVAAAQPDLVLLKSYMQDSIGNTLEQLDIPVVYLDFETPEQYERDLATLGQLFGDPKRAQEMWSYYQDILDRVAKGTESLTEVQKPRVLLLQYTDKGGGVAFKVPPASWIQTQMVTLAGGVPIWTETAQGGGWVVVNLEQIAAWNPDQIYLINYFGSAVEVVTRLQTDPQWSELPAVRAGQLIPFAGDFHSWDQPDTRWGLGLLWLAQHIQPECFADVDIQTEVYHFFETYYGLDRATIDAEIVSLLSASQMQP
ncbi:MAG: ABC transporter substrate-binding protein [Anaerolineae bacterium]|nr:ABC transporter substrate-binding protein [Anaerolineae bacterium]